MVDDEKEVVMVHVISKINTPSKVRNSFERKFKKRTEKNCCYIRQNQKIVKNSR